MRAVLLVVVMLAGPGQTAWAQPQQQVLVLYSTRRDAEVVAVGERELPRILAAGGPGTLDYYAEFIDQARLAPDYGDVFREYLRRKYAAQSFDLVIAMDAGALDFLVVNRADLFPAVPVVFFSSRPSPPRLPNSTGVNAVIDLGGTVALAAALQPGLRHIFVITGADRSYETLARAELQPYAARYAITYLAALDSAALERRLASLPDESMVYYVHVTRDGESANFNALAYLDRAAEAARAPTYSWVDSTIGRGVVGGSVRSLTAQMEAVGMLARRVLDGERADDIPIARPDLNVVEVDWRQLQRWGLSERLPAGAIVRFREPSTWERYRRYIIGASVVLVAQALVITALLVERQRRHRAERHLRRSEAALRTSYDRVRDLGTRLLHAQEVERSTIARELHDDVSQQLALLTLELDRLRATDALERAQSIARTVHDLSHWLHPDKLHLLGLTAAIRGLERDLSRLGTAIAFTHDDLPPKLPDDVTINLYRIAQEALHNAVMHGHAERVSLHLGSRDAQVTLTVIDDGVGFHVDAAWSRGLGLASMRERVQALGGTFDIVSSPGSGTRVSVRVPLEHTFRTSA
jgi:signal transduction histidine kinase